MILAILLFPRVTRMAFGRRMNMLNILLVELNLICHA